MEVYADVLFVINFCMDYICLYITAKLCRVKISALRLVVAAVAGGIYAVFSCILSGFAAVLCALASSILICIIAFKWDGASKLWKRALVFYAVSALTGGTMYGLYSLSGKFTYYNGTLYADIDAFPLICFGAIISVIILILLKKERTAMTAKTATLTLESAGETYTCDGLTDTGLLLCDPISADAVILIKKQAYDRLTHGAAVQTLPGYRLIPSDRGLISAFRPDKVTVTDRKGKKTHEVRAIVGIDVSDGTFGGMEALIPSSII